MSTWNAGRQLRLNEAVTDGLTAAAQLVLDAAKDGAPVLSGRLRDSGSFEVDGLTAAVGFADVKAVAAHENTHDRLRNGKRAKFLELALADNAGAVGAVLRDSAARVLR